MRKVFLDLGCRMGEGFSDFAPKYNVDETWEIYAFEVNPDAIKQYQANIDSGKYEVLKNKNFTLINKGVWESDTVLPLHREMVNKEACEKHADLQKWYDDVNKKFNEGKVLSRHDFNIPDSGGSTLAPLFKTMDRTGAPQNRLLKFHPEPINVECIDFAKWMKENFSETDHIVLKMDIEGSEFKVLPKMIENGTLNYVNSLIVEWHHWEFKQYKTLRTQLMKEINRLNIDYIEWK